MNAGKTTTLLQSNHNYRERGMLTLMFTPSVDDRYKKGLIKSRIGLEKEAIPFDPDFNFFQYISSCVKKSSHPIKCILVDEAQFIIKTQVLQLTQVVDELKIPVLCYGLRTDFRGEPFEGSKYLLAWSEEMTEIKTICHCGKKATMSARVNEQGQIVSEGEQIEIGGNDKYVSLCRKHWTHKELSSPHTLKEPFKTLAVAF